MLNTQELEYGIDHQNAFISSIRYGGPYQKLMSVYEQWKTNGSQDLHNKLCILVRTYDRYLADRKKELDRGYKLLLELNFELMTGVSPKNLKRCEVSQLSNHALDLLVLYKYGVPYLNFGDLTKNQYYGAVVTVVTNHHSCSYCNSILHTKKQCPILRRKQCFKCHRFGHVAPYCRTMLNLS
jgi:hypothetical protein